MFCPSTGPILFTAFPHSHEVFRKELYRKPLWLYYLDYLFKIFISLWALRMRVLRASTLQR
jgi:hypothetical protein